MLARLPKSAISVCPIVLLCLISYANYTIYSFRFNVWLLKNAQGKRSLLIQECIAQLPHPCEASGKLIPQISPLRRKYLLLLHHIHMNRCSQPTVPLLASLKSRMKPTSAQKTVRVTGLCTGETCCFSIGAQPIISRSGCTDPLKLCLNGSPRLLRLLNSYASTGKHLCYGSSSVLALHRTDVY